MDLRGKPAGEGCVNFIETRAGMSDAGFYRRAQNLFTLTGFSDMQAAMCHFATIVSRQHVTRFDGPVRDVVR